MAEPKETQLKLFTVEPHGLTLREAAQRLSVSQATIRNWINSGLLNTVDGKLLQSDVDTFALAQLHNKLKSRANKLRKDSHDQSELSETICGYIQSNELSGEEIALKYESSLSESFKNKEGVFGYDTEQRYILNSANLFILKPSFPISYKNIVALLNSDFMNWLFQSVFCTHKILRGDLEELPIWTDYFEQYAFFSEEILLEFLKIEKKNGTYCVKKQVC